MKKVTRKPAVKEAMSWDELMQGMKNPLSRTADGNYNYGGAALMGGGTGLATYIISRLLGMKGGPSLVASILGGLGGAHYAMGKQFAANNGKYDPMSLAWLRDIINRQKAKAAPAAAQNVQTNTDPNSGRDDSAYREIMEGQNGMTPQPQSQAPAPIPAPAPKQPTVVAPGLKPVDTQAIQPQRPAAGDNDGNLLYDINESGQLVPHSK